MTQKYLPHSQLSQSDITCLFVLDTTNPQAAVSKINSYIKSKHCENMDVDISCLNIPDACYVSTMCSTQHFIKYPEGKINWKVSSPLTEQFSLKCSLGNSSYIF